jgi:Ca-activated chloride channel family protein
MYPEIVTCAVVLLGAAAERLHARRCARVAAIGALCWGLTSLLLLPPRAYKVNELTEGELRHLLLVLDVSPSMRLEDAGPGGKQSRMKRSAALLKSFFERIPIDRYRVSVVATYTEAKPVVVATRDLEVVRNILEDLPMHYAFRSGATNLFAGLDEAAKLAHPWRPGSATLVLVSDGDTVPATGMPKLPAAVKHVLVVGVGDAHAGKFIDGHQSRQDASTLRQVATRLGGAYHNGNEKHLPTDLLRQVTFESGRGALERLTRREYALLACGLGAALLAILPLALHFGGTRWAPGVNEFGRRGTLASRLHGEARVPRLPSRRDVPCECCSSSAGCSCRWSLRRTTTGRGKSRCGWTTWPARSARRTPTSPPRNGRRRPSATTRRSASSRPSGRRKRAASGWNGPRRRSSAGSCPRRTRTSRRWSRS